MHSHIHTISFRGIDTIPVSVQVHLSNGLPAMAIVGLADKAVGESRERVRAALSSLGLALPAKRIAVNLSPADIVKEGAHFDLPIALGVLVAMGALPQDAVDEHPVLGELSLDGSIQPVSGILPAALCAAERSQRLICPAENGPEAAWGGDIDILAAGSLTELLNHLRGTQLLSPVKPGMLTTPPSGPDMADLRGQETARRAMEIAATGGHNLLMIGPPGAGKSMLAARLPDLLPPLSAREALEVTVIHSIIGQVPKGGLCQKRPFREPHHSASMAALVGGGQKAMPGEISLAHNGVLFLDELAEFNRVAIDSLRQPLEIGEIIIARANNHIRYPARFQLIAAMNPCRCGYLADASRACSRAPDCARLYMAKVSGPMLDRFDIMIDVAELPPSELLSPSVAENSASVHRRILAACEFGAGRHNGSNSQVNARLSADQIDRHIVLAPDIKRLLEEAMTKQKLSARGFHKVLRVAQTIADLERGETLQRHHVLEALSYRGVLLSGPLPG